jgi:hypothetical protein
MDQDCTAGDCLIQCNGRVFSRVVVDHAVEGGSKLYWEFNQDFIVKTPLEFTLFVGRTNNVNADDWTQVGLPADDAPYLVDDVQRLFGTQGWTHYRIRLLDGHGAEYFSDPASIQSTLPWREWLKAENLARKERLRLRMGAGTEGLLLKRKIYGDPCPLCLDYQSGESTNSGCERCYGTKIDGGYFPAIPCVYADFHINKVHHHVEPPRGSVGNQTARAILLADPMLFEEDVWVDAGTDARWYVHEIEPTIEVRGRPVIQTVTMIMAEYTDRIYKFPIPR